MGKDRGIRHSGLVASWVIALTGLLGTAGAWAQDAPALNPDVALEYTVKKGDTLWDISSYYLQDPWLWPELWNANPQVANPHLIYPGEKLYLVYVDGRPRLQREPPQPAVNERFVRLTPEIRSSTLEPAIPTIPLDAIRGFLNGPRVIDRADYNRAPYVVGFEDQRLLGGESVETFVREAVEEEGYRYNVVRIGQTYRDPDNNALLGYEAVPVGRLEVQSFGEVATARMTESYRETRRADRLLPLSYDRFNPNFYPHAPEQAVSGRIIAVFDGVSEIGQYQIVTLNLGSEDGLEAGHVLDVRQAGELVRDPTKLFGRVRLPDQNAGLLMVFKTYENISYGLIMSATRAIHVQDRVTNPARS